MIIPVYGSAWAGCPGYEGYKGRYLKGFVEVSGGDPLQANIDQAYSIGIWYNANKGLTREAIINQRDDRSWTSLSSQLGGPSIRYIADPLSDAIIDMRHMSIIGKYGKEGIGDAIENFQWLMGKPSGRHPQDYFSNTLGDTFYRSPYGDMIKNCPTCFPSAVRMFLLDPNYYYIR